MNPAGLTTPRALPGLVAGLLALGVHVVFLLVLVVGIRWQIEHPEPIMAELWTALPSLPAPPVSPPPAVEPKPDPAPVPPPPAPPVAPPRPPAADIALEQRKKAEAEQQARRLEQQAAEEKARREAAQREAEAQRQARERQLAEQRRRDLLRQMEEEELAQRLQQEEAAAELRRQQQAAAQAAQAAQRAEAARRQAAVEGLVAQHRDLISAKVRGNTRLPDDIKGNPEVRFNVRLLPTGEVVDVKLERSSGHAGYDEAVERAIRRSSPLPLPEDRDARAAFVPTLIFVHRPRE